MESAKERAYTTQNNKNTTIVHRYGFPNRHPPPPQIPANRATTHPLAQINQDTCEIQRPTRTQRVHSASCHPPTSPGVERVGVRFLSQHLLSTFIRSNITSTALQPINQSTGQPAKSIDASINQSSHQQPTHQATEPSHNKPIDNSINPNTHPSIIHLSIHACIHPTNHISIYQLQTSEAMFRGDGLQGISPAGSEAISSLIWGPGIVHQGP